MKRYTQIFSIITITLFVVLYFILSYFNYYASDDFYFIALVREMGIIDGMTFCYKTCGARWSSWLLSNFIFSLSAYPISIKLYHLLILLFSIISVNYTFKQIIKLIRLELDKKQIFILSFLFLIFLFLTTYSISESWFWITNLSTYLLNVFVFIFVLGLILNNKKSILNYLFILLLIIYLSGTSEAYVFVEIAFFSLLFYLYRKEKLIAYKLIFSIILLSVSLVVSFFAVGNNLRADSLPEPSLMKAIIVSFRGLGKISLIEIPSKIHYYIIFIIIFWTFGSFQKSKKTLKSLKIPFIYITIFTIVLIYISLFPSAWSLSEMPSKRAMLFANLLICSYVFYWSFMLGAIYNIRKIISYSAFILLVIVLIFQNYNQFKIVNNYRIALHDRFNFIESRKLNKDIIILKRLPKSGMLYTAEINTFDWHYRNQHYKKYFSLKGSVVLEKTKENDFIIP